MSTIALFAGVAVLLGAAAIWELAGSRGEALGVLARDALATVSGGRARSVAEAGLRLGIPPRLERAGLSDRIGVGGVLAAKLCGAGLAALVASAVAGTAPDRLAVVVSIGLPVAGFFAPDAMLEREARIRRRRLVGALPDALDMLAVGAAAGRAPSAALGEIGFATDGPLARELRIVTADVDAGASLGEAFDALRRRAPSPEIGAVASALERSRRFGSPLADQLRQQATSLRGEERRSIEERAARAAPKIQLVVALVLVPSVLLMITAALIASSEELLAGF